MSLENGRSKFWFGIHCYYYWGWIDTPHYFIDTYAQEKQKICGGLGAYNLIKESVEFKISSKVFTEMLNSLIKNESVIVNTFQNRECISLPKENFQKIETVKENITEQFHPFKNDFLDEFNKLKTNFFHEVKFKDSILKIILKR